MMFLIKPNKIFILLLLVVFATSLKIKETLKGFEKEKIKIEKKMNSMRLGNYLRRLMMKNNNLITENMVFLESTDFNIENKDINYNDMNTDGENDVDFKSRVYAFKWAQTNFNKLNLKPFSVSPDSNEKVKGWNVMNVLLLGNNDSSKVLKICFPNNIEENFSIVTLFNQTCKKMVKFVLKKIKKINEYKMFDNFSYMGQKQPKVDKFDENDIQGKQKTNMNDEISNKQKELLKASQNQHFKETEKDMEKLKKGKKEKKKKSKQENEDKMQEPTKQVKKSKKNASTQEENFNIEDMK